MDYVNATTPESSESLDSLESGERFSGSVNYLSDYLSSNFTGKEEKKFLDFGCGSFPPTLEIASNAGYKAFGYEFDVEVSAQAKHHTGKEIFSANDLAGSDLRFDCIFLGDVLEHLIEPAATLKDLRNLLTEDGVLIAQGPLEGALTLTHTLVKLRSLLSGNRTCEIAPYHVSLATRGSMDALFRKSEFIIKKTVISEIQWPATTLFDALKTRSLRNITLSICKLIDRFLAFFLKSYGNRYFLIATSILQ